MARFPARRAGRIGPRLGDEAGVLARALAGPRALGVALGLDEGLFLVLRRLENAAPPGEGGSPVWHVFDISFYADRSGVSRDDIGVNTGNRRAIEIFKWRKFGIGRNVEGSVLFDRIEITERSG